MKVSLGRFLFLAGALALLACLAPAIGARNGVAQGGLAIGVDADPAGNSATSLGSVDPCISVQKGDTFQIDIFVADVEDLLGWEIYFSFDGDVVNVVDRDVGLFLATSANSEVFDASDVLPSTGGLYRVGAVDLSQPPSPDSGSGVLARLTLEAVGAGLGQALLISIDANNDGATDLGPQLSNSDLQAIGDANGDGFFDGTVLSGQIAVDRDCAAEPTQTPLATTTPAPSPTEGASPVVTTTTTGTPPATTETARPTPRITPTPGTITSPTPGSDGTATPEGDGGTDWTSGGFIAMYVIVGGVAALLLGGGAFLATTRRRGP